MINSHYIPRLILKKFSDDKEHLIYGDLIHKKCEIRRLESVFSKKGYYSDDLEHDLSKSIESRFAQLLNDNLLKSKDQIILSREELFLLKKFLLIGSLRKSFTRDEIETRNGPAVDEFVYERNKKFFESRIDEILKCNTSEELLKYCDTKCEEMIDNGLLRAIKRIVYGYMSFVSTEICGENLIISDCACGYWYGEGPFAKLDLIFNSKSPYAIGLLDKIDPADYVYFPISKHLGVLAICPIFRKEYGIFDVKKYSKSGLEKRLGFDDKHLLNAPAETFLGAGGRTPNKYVYTKTQLSLKNAVFFNILTMQTSCKFIAFSNYEKVKCSIESYIKNQGMKHDLSFIANHFRHE